MGAEWRPLSKATRATAAAPAAGTAAPEPPWQTYLAPWSVVTTTAAEAPPRPKVLVTAEDLHQLLAAELTGRLAPDCRLFLTEDAYFLPPLADARALVAEALARRRHRPAAPNDDAAFALKAFGADAAYKDGQRRPAYCLGLIWGELPQTHALNWMVNDDGRLRLIEPQEGQIREPGPELRHVTFLLG